MSSSKYPPLGPDDGTSQAIVTAQGWDLAKYSSKPVPGLCRVEGSILVKFDPKKKKGVHGSRPTFYGLDGQRFKLEIGVWRQPDIDAADAWCRTYFPTSKSTTKGITAAVAKAKRAIALSGAYGTPYLLEHASIINLGVIFAIVIGGTSWRPKPEWGVQGRQLTVDLLHWIPEVANATVTPSKGQRLPPNVRGNAAASPPTPTQQPGFGGPPKLVKLVERSLP